MVALLLLQVVRIQTENLWARAIIHEYACLFANSLKLSPQGLDWHEVMMVQQQYVSCKLTDFVSSYECLSYLTRRNMLLENITPIECLFAAEYTS
jgi:hypothetical protein